MIDGLLVDLTAAEQADWEADRAARMSVPEAVPALISRAQFFKEATSRGKITRAQFRSIMSGTLPAPWQSSIDTMTLDKQIEIEGSLLASSFIRRASSVCALVQTAFAYTDAQMDDFFRVAAAKW